VSRGSLRASCGSRSTRPAEAQPRQPAHRAGETAGNGNSSVGRPWSSKFLGFSFTTSRANPQIRLHWKTIKRFRKRVKELTRRTCGRSLARVLEDLMSYVRGWWQYYGIAESVNRLRPLAPWIRRRLRALIWKQWSRPKGDRLPGTKWNGSNGAERSGNNRRIRVQNLLKRGISRTFAVTTGCARKGPWRMSRVKWVVMALPDQYFVSLGLLFPWIEPA